MINKCKVEMIGEELYNVRESLREGDEKIVLRAKGIESGRSSILVFFHLRCQDHPCIGPNRLTEAKFLNPFSTNTYCGLCFGPRPNQ